MILSWLYYQRTHDRKETKPNVQVAADSLHLTAATAEKHLAELSSKDLVTEGGVLTLKCETGKFFTLPKEVFLLALPPSDFLVYAYLLYCEDRRTHQCHPSYRTIAETTGLSLNTAVKSVGGLTDKNLITVERSYWFNEQGMKRNGNNIYTILPARAAVEDYYQRQLRRLELDMEHSRIQKKQANLNRRPSASLCASTPVQATPDPSPAT